jgi:hypothetical protein
MKIKFYDVVGKKPVMIDKADTKEMMSKNGRKMLVAEHNGRKLYRFI